MAARWRFTLRSRRAAQHRLHRESAPPSALHAHARHVADTLRERLFTVLHVVNRTRDTVPAITEKTEKELLPFPFDILIKTI